MHSTTQAKSNGEMGQPCLTPLCSSNPFEVILLILAELVAEVYSSLIDPIHEFGGESHSV